MPALYNLARALAGSLVFNHTSQNYDFSPAISGAGSVFAEAGTTVLSGANSYYGGTTVSGGVLVANHIDGGGRIDALWCRTCRA